MGDLLNWRRKAELLILAFLTLFAFAAIGDQWIGWATMTAMFAALVMVDFMFFDDSAFVFEPDVKVRRQRRRPRRLRAGGRAGGRPRTRSPLPSPALWPVAAAAAAELDEADGAEVLMGVGWAPSPLGPSGRGGGRW